MNERVEWLREEYKKAEQENRVEDMDLIAEYLEIEEINFVILKL